MVRLKLDKVLEEANITRYELSKRSGVQFQVVDNYFKNKVVRYDSSVLERLCTALNCTPGDLIEFRKEDGKRK